MVQASVARPGSTPSSGFRSCTVIEVRPDGDDAVAITIEPPPGERWRFAHGQHLVFRRDFDGTEIRRSYSLCAPAPDGPLTVAIRLVPGGVFSTWANTELVVGDRIDALPPSGHFTHQLDPLSSRRYLLVAGGSGITPMASIAATTLAAEPSCSMTLLFVNRTSGSTMQLDEVEALRNRYLDRFTVWYLFTREATPLELLSGRPDESRLDALIDRGLLPIEIDRAFLCGPEGLVEAVAKVLRRRGVDDDKIGRERFTAGQGRAARPAPRPVESEQRPVAEAQVTLHGRTSTVPLYEGDTLLEATERLRPDVPYSCRAGVCSSCVAELSDGEVDQAVCHGLDEAERARGYVLTCQSFPRTDRLVASFDI